MGHPEYGAFSAEIPVNDPVKMDQFQEAMNHYHDELNKHIVKVAEELGLSVGAAADIVYIRGRSRWTQQLENRLVAAYKAGHSIFPNGDEEEKLQELGF